MVYLVAFTKSYPLGTAKRPTFAMFWLLTICLLALLIVPPIVALMESLWNRQGSRDVGFWAWARSVGGTCHVPWGRRVSPIVRFELPDGEARGRAVQLPGWRRWRVELRGYQDIPFDFAARLCCPPREPLRWRTPGLTPVDIYADEPEYLSDFSMETTEDRLLRWLLRHEQTRDTLEHLQANCGAESLELLLTNSVIILRADTPRNWKVGSAVEHIGPPLVEMLRKLSSDLADLGNAMMRAGDFDLDIPKCAVCGQAVSDEVHQCSSCGVYTHRGCLDMLDGCAHLDCDQAVDALPGLPALLAQAAVDADAH